MDDLALIHARAEAEEDLKKGRTLSSQQVRQMMQKVLKLHSPLAW